MSCSLPLLMGTDKFQLILIDTVYRVVELEFITRPCDLHVKLCRLTNIIWKSIVFWSVCTTFFKVPCWKITSDCTKAALAIVSMIIHLCMCSAWLHWVWPSFALRPIESIQGELAIILIGAGLALGGINLITLIWSVGRDFPS